jgi:hypothetical protein
VLWDDAVLQMYIALRGYRTGLQRRSN